MSEEVSDEMSERVIEAAKITIMNNHEKPLAQHGEGIQVKRNKVDRAVSYVLTTAIVIETVAFL